MLKKIQKKIIKRLDFLDVHTREVIKKSSSSLMVKVLGMLFGLVVSVFLGRTLGTVGLGVINLANKVIFLILSFVLLGFPNLLIKNISISYHERNYDNIFMNLTTAIIVNGGIGVIIIIVLIISSKVLSYSVFEEPRLFYPLIIAAIAMFPQILSRIFSSGLIGIKKIWQSNLVDKTLSMVFIFTGLMLLYLLDIQINIINTAILYGISRLLVTLVVGLYWKKLFNNHLIGKTKISLIKSALPFWGVTITNISLASLDTIMLGWLSNSRDVGLYSIAFTLAFLTSFFLQITNSVLAPKIAALYSQKKMKDLTTMVQQVTLGLLLFGIIPFIVFLIFGKEILSLWGNQFTKAYWPLIILSFGQMFNISTGSVTTLLNMCGLEKLHYKITLAFLILFVISNYFMITLFGLIGVAIVTSFITITINFTKMIFVRIHLGFWSIPALIK